MCVCACYLDEVTKNVVSQPSDDEDDDDLDYDDAEASANGPLSYQVYIRHRLRPHIALPPRIPHTYTQLIPPIDTENA